MLTSCWTYAANWKRPIVCCLDRKFELVYEKKSGSRAPDFAVMFRTHIPCNVEVTRHRMLESGEPPINSVSKFMETLCDKVGQMVAGGIQCADDLFPRRQER